MRNINTFLLMAATLAGAMAGQTSLLAAEDKSPNNVPIAPSAETRTTPRFTPLVPLPAPRLVAYAQEYPGGHYNASNLNDGKTQTEYSSDGKGTNTFLEFDFGRPTQVAAFRHLNRNDPATVAASELTFTDSAGRVVARESVRHVNQRGGETFFVLPQPVTAQRVRWRVTALGPQGYGTVGGAEIGFFTAGKAEAAPRSLSVTAKVLPLLERQGTALVQLVKITLHYPYATPAPAVLRVEGAAAQPVPLKLGDHTVEVAVPVVKAEQARKIEVEALGQIVATHTLTQRPARQLTVYILPHSHTDIGYTEIQTDIEKKQVNNLLQGIAYARQTADYPEGARFRLERRGALGGRPVSASA